ncbi:hypothetical protein HS041_20255 [Planomonospora sp. ID67723]|uniref:hypothetical protein n=1 Tax=Planomonospora sp. ID67723 TaxID=2738134 RepID=UPI0018C38750|nr:hypothetical protein [Planomonospora sp. ID67723]MBG0830104.1 hypothetical protein [Planomonospora sp. ID67723]
MSTQARARSRELRDARAAAERHRQKRIRLAVAVVSSGAILLVPARYARDGQRLTLISKRSRTRWRSIEGGAPLRFTLRGEERTGQASVSHDPERVRASVRAVAHRPSSA